MLLLVATVHAALPWECPPLDAPPDAPQFRTDAGLGDTFDALREVADAWIEADCAWTETLLDSGATEATCVTSVGAFVTITTAESAESGRDFPTDYHESHAWSLVLDLPPGADTWTALDLSRTSSSSTMGGASGGGGVARANWTGAVLDLPDDGWFTLTSASSCFYSECDRTYTVETAACGWSYGESGGTGLYWVEAGGHRAEVATYLMECRTYPRKAHYDGALYGHVDLATWTLDEVDRDGWSEAAGDCDDADPTVYPCAPEIAADGVDQDCDGADTLDADGDGYEVGPDCDDTTGHTHPGASDPPADGVDQDCDGADDVDADGDGFTADGDDYPADCDESDADIRPYRTDPPCDGVDQNCDGVDACDDADTALPEDDTSADTAAADTAAEASASARPAPDADAGCRGAAATLLLPFALLLRRRRAPAP